LLHLQQIYSEASPKSCSGYRDRLAPPLPTRIMAVYQYNATMAILWTKGIAKHQIGGTLRPGRCDIRPLTLPRLGRLPIIAGRMEV
jgi:hypothetical protein